MNNPFAQQLSPHSPTFTISAMTLVLGLMIGLAWITNDNRQSRIRSLGPDQAARLQSGDLTNRQEMQSLQDNIEDLRGKITDYEKVLSQQSGEAKALNESVQEMKIVAGLTELVGPGIIITLTDSEKATKNAIDEPFLQDSIIHDLDILRVVNELRASNAEAVSVNGQRVTSLTACRCVGPVIRVNDVPIAPPYVITAIGDSVTLAGAMELPGGVIDEIRQGDPAMVKIEKVEMTKVPAFKGSTLFKYAQIPKEKPKS